MADTRDFEKAAMPHLSSVYRAAYALCGEASKAEDLVQAAYLKALQRFDSFRPGTNCRAWLLRILRNTWFDELRHKKFAGKTVTANESLIADRPAGEQTTWSDAKDILENFSDEEVIRALGELSDDQRLTLFLIDVEQLSQDEAAEITGVPVGTVKSRLSRARAAMEARLEAHAKDLGFIRRKS